MAFPNHIFHLNFMKNKSNSRSNNLSDNKLNTKPTTLEEIRENL